MEQIPEIIHPSWHPHVQRLFDDPKMLLIKNQVLPRCKFYPDSGKIFRVFEMPLQDIKVCVLGQDPYYNGSANGLAFAVDIKTPIPKSLKIIRDEVINSKVERDDSIPIEGNKWKTLEHWEKQKVFLLNTALTVQVGVPNSHTGQWSWFTREIVKIIAKEVIPVWLMWGAKAKAFKDYIPNYWVYNGAKFSSRPDTNYALEAPHPNAESYNDSKYKFTGCNHFNLCNDILKTKESNNLINW